MGQSLVLWRHAQAHPAQPGQSDLARELTPLGQQQARAMADWLRARLPTSVVCASPAQRAQQTAAAWGAPFLTEAVLSPEAPAQDLIAWLQVTLSPVPLILVGHQPILGQVAAGLMTGQCAPWVVKKGAIWWLQRRERALGAAQWVLRAVLSPAELVSRR